MNVDGQWRPEGRGGRWRSVDEDPAAAAAADAASHAVCSRIWFLPDEPPTSERPAPAVSVRLGIQIDTNQLQASAGLNSSPVTAHTRLSRLPCSSYAAGQTSAQC